jgi:chloramphenicol O-acetyltransferase
MLRTLVRSGLLFVVWHITFGKIPVSRGGWKTYSYPIFVSGKKIEDDGICKYAFNTEDAFKTDEGFYATFVKG